MTLLEAAEQLQLQCVGRATGEVGNDDYLVLRGMILNSDKLKSKVPSFIKNCRDSFQFWHFIKMKYPTYQERRQFIWDEFRPLLECLETENVSPTHENVSNILPQIDSEHVQEIWNRALNRRIEDPEGAITLARTLLESVCKNILDKENIDYDSDLNLTKLYKKTAGFLNLSPGQHVEEVFKQILGGCTSVVEGLGALRNRISDAHGQGSRPVKPKSRHAELAINLSGSMAMFLVSTWMEKTSQN